jgi:hypothetical protein
MTKDATIVEPHLHVQIEPLLVRRGDAAQLLSVSPRMFDDLVDSGLIGKVRIGGVVAFDPQDLRAFVKRARREPEKVQAAIDKLRSARKVRRDDAGQPSPG